MKDLETMFCPLVSSKCKQEHCPHFGEEDVVIHEHPHKTQIVGHKGFFPRNDIVRETRNINTVHEKYCRKYNIYFERTLKDTKESYEQWNTGTDIG